MRLDDRIHTRTAHTSSLARIRPARSHSALSASLSPCSPSFAYRSTFFLSSTFLLLTLQYTITVHTMYGWRGSSFYDSNSMYLGEIAFCIGRTDGSPIPPPFCMSYTPVPSFFLLDAYVGVRHDASASPFAANGVDIVISRCSGLPRLARLKWKTHMSMLDISSDAHLSSSKRVATRWDCILSVI